MGAVKSIQLSNLFLHLSSYEHLLKVNTNLHGRCKTTVFLTGRTLYTKKVFLRIEHFDASDRFVNLRLVMLRPMINIMDEKIVNCD